LPDWHRFTPSNFEYDFEREKLSAHQVTFNEAIECFFTDFEIRRNKKFRDRYQLIWQNARRKEAQDHLPTQAGQRSSHHHRLALMNTRKKRKSTTLNQEAIDQLVIDHSDDESAWGAPSRVKRSEPASLSIPGDLAARAAFLASLHREAGLDKWVERVLRERVEIEELAFAEVKRERAS
jgi:predicted HicB family RNase H-like nuclease